MDKGVLKQLAYFRRDYRDGEAIAQRYLKMINSPEYLAKSGHQKIPKSSSNNQGFHIRDKYKAAIEIFPGCRDMTKRCISHKLRRLGYCWDKKRNKWCLQEAY
jgi:hypothetical protein